MLRDSVKNKEYFELYISRQQDRAHNFNDKVEKQDVIEERIPAIKRKIADIKLYNFIARYSLGETVSSLEEDFSEAIRSREESIALEADEVEFILDTYIDLLWLFSISLMIEVKDEHFERLIQVYRRHNQKDLLIDTIISTRQKDYVLSQHLLYPQEFKTLSETLATAKPDAELKLKKFLEKEWYKGMKDTAWHGNHKSKHDTYFGYWSFESGAIVKIMGLDDSSFKDNQYYPYDLVHYKG